MFSLKITQAELNKLALIEHLKNIPQVDEKKEYNTMLRKRNKDMLNSLKRVKKQDKYTYINHLNKFIANKNITSEIESKEIEWAEYLIIN